ncbi:hypothetical protein E308F_17390 [Moorella sp. E308F]|uniref:response regulator transcription factor n=1 Tax=unclassified Neomoorella TaxID=2676739 RepID=UPI0010FFBF17|nr:MULTISPECIES: response regulator transcription factor [unclassified Moorella (in: firmicutes)]GEA15495.1 hypothetical protein E308F_17390 [Moorella sp. E308F]GEA19647.1 hypothetical protein E306M_27850 [Moorella sp. E306M]
MEIWIVENDIELAKQQEEIITMELPGCDVKTFASLRGAFAAGTGRPDIVILDVSAISEESFSLDGYNSYAYLLRIFIEKHRSSAYIIYSMVSRWAKDIIEELKKEFDDLVVHEADMTKSAMLVQFLKNIAGSVT